jgi:hypothetical protein
MTMRSCKHLGFCYAQQRKYDQATLQFGRAIEKINFSPGEKLEHKVRVVQRWICQVERMKTERVGDCIGQSGIQIEGNFSNEMPDSH